MDDGWWMVEVMEGMFLDVGKTNGGSCSGILDIMLSNGKSSPSRGENKKYLSCHHLVNHIRNLQVVN